ncbi:porin [Seohaeicola sp. SP36]|uniref:porin n=1 Tax=unclassified Seohaeicola TaxID=2641111 RepID=UPI00237AB441|nr:MULTISPECIES: porin [unclassified Seohaeicola]MDD9706752.1 porin [Seohaeicola sp. 4SK31]MDD9734458.1 porin [Seohaeicola sp. SP36]
MQQFGRSNPFYYGCGRDSIIATTALVATAGVAAADITMGGFGYVGVTDNAAGTNATSAVRLTFTGSVETDGGVAFTAFGRLTQANNDASGSDAGVNYKTVAVSYAGLRLVVGNTHTAMNTFARGGHFWGYDNGGVWARTAQGSGMGAVADTSAGARVLATYAFGDFTVGVGSTVDGEAVSATNPASMDFGARYSANGLSVGAAFDDESNWQAEVGYTIGEIGVRAALNSDDEYIVSGSYAINSAITVAAAYTSYDVAGGTEDDIGLNLTYNLGGGATLSATAGQAGSGEVIGLGVQFSF